MNYRASLLEPGRQDSFNQGVLEAYKRSDESARMDMYMTYRDLREQFGEIEASSVKQRETGPSRAEAGHEKMKWCLCGRLRKAFSG
jgi:hypothetical protein